MLNTDQIVMQIVMTIVIKALDLLFGQIGEWLKERRAKRKRKQKSKPRSTAHHLQSRPAHRQPKANHY